MANLTKREAGTPLSEAEHQQRVDAAKARWSLAATGAGAAVVAGAAAHAVGRVRQARYDKAREIAGRVLGTKKAGEAKIDRYFQAVDKITDRYKGKKLIPASIKTLRSQARRADVRLKTQMAEHGAFYQMDRDLPAEWASSDLAGETRLREARDRLTLNAKDLQANARESYKVKTPHKFAFVKEFERFPRKGKERMFFNRHADGALRDAIHNGHYPEGHTLKDISDQVVSTKGPERKALLDHLREQGFKGRIVKPVVEEVVTPHTRFTPAGETTVPSYPTAANRKKLAQAMLEDVRGRSLDWLYRTEASNKIKFGAARAAAKPLAADIMHSLGVLRSTPVKLAVLGAGALAGGIAGYFAHKELGKADGIDDGDSDAAQEAIPGESDLAERVARALAGWKDDIVERLGQARGASLHSTMLTDLDRAMRPLDAMLVAGAAIPAKEFDPNSAVLGFTTQARSPLPEAFVASYRLDRVRELAGDQRDAIKAVLLNAAKEGSSPDEMARRIRQTVGLTAHQAGLVLNYRKQLETLDGQALTRALRDKRYDGPIKKAIDGGKALSVEQIDRFTDSYHRKFLAYRAQTIARTEGLRAANNGHIAGVDQLLEGQPGMTVVKTWMATQDSRTRHDHRALNGKSVVGLETPFVCDDGSTIRWPHDPDAEAAQVINCRCTIVTRLVPRSVVARMGANAVEEDAQDAYA